jgi:ATPase subunit of ABC transporter with duplicated ATPase domains
MSAVHFSHVSFSYSSAVPILRDVSFDLGSGWTGLVGGNGVGKSPLLALIAGRHQPDAGHIVVEPGGLPPVLCDQRVDSPTSDIVEFGGDWSRDAVRLRASLELDTVSLDRWSTLSPGERKRWQIGAALVRRPEVLLLDEPTNHLDREARDHLLAALDAFDGCGVVVSHDRDLLNSLTTRTMRVAEHSVELWNAPYADARDAWTLEQQLASERRQKLRRDEAKLRRRLADQRRTAEQKDAERLRERRAAGIHDLDTRGAVATGRHASGQKAASRERSVTRAELQSVSSDIEAMPVTRDLGGDISFPGAPPRKEFLVRYAGPVMAGERALFDVDLAVRRGDRIRIAGPNGIGKTSVMMTLLAHLAIPDELALHLGQETTAAEARHLLGDLRALDAGDRGQVLSLVARLGADPADLLASDQPSPGEARKLALALGLGTPTWLLALDEPTNHLDLPSIERLEEALDAYGGALLLISHDDGLADRLTDSVWSVRRDGVDEA